MIRAPLAAAGSVVALAAAAAPALGNEPGYSLNISGPSSTTAGQSVLFQASGTNPSTDFFTSWLDVYAIPASAMSSCPDGYITAMQVANTTGGEQVTNGQREEADSSGNWSMPFGYAPSRAGRMLICGYTNDGATGTLATASVVLDVAGSGGGGGGGNTSPGGGLAKPANTRKPTLKRSGGKLVCRPGSWANKPDGYGYSWRVDGKKKRGASAQRLRISRGLHGRGVQCRVTAYNDAGAATATSRVLRVR